MSNIEPIAQNRKPANRKIRLMIVDDHPLFRADLRRILELENGLTIVSEVSNGAQVLEKVRKLKPQVILMDPLLPGKHGLHVTRELTNSQSGCSVIILTAHHDDEQMLRALDAGATHYFTKDVNPKELIRAIHQVASLVRVCKHCGTENNEDDRFCQNCGTPLHTPIRNSEKDLTGLAFEAKCMDLLRQRGFDVEATRRTSDGGIDLVASSYDPFVGGKYVVQCKDWSGKVGVTVVRELYGVVHSENANRGILITSSSFTQEALHFADGKRLELIDGDKLNFLLG